MKFDLQRKQCTDFLKKAYEMVNDPSTDSMVSWSPNGKAFIVWLPEECKRDVLPKYLKVKAFGKFDYIGFRRHVSPGEPMVFSHNDFVRGKPELLNKICQRHVAQLKAMYNKTYKPFYDRLRSCKTKEEMDLARSERMEMLDKESRERREAFMKVLEASRAKAAALEAKAAEALALEDHQALEDQHALEA